MWCCEGEVLILCQPPGTGLRGGLVVSTFSGQQSLTGVWGQERAVQ